jgi:uncharacterized membrane protein (UPF0127 family)
MALGRKAVSRRGVVLGTLAFGALAAVPGLGQAQTLETVTVVTASGRHVFQAEVMRTPDERARGLMFRRFLPADRGMLFDFQRVEPVAMWMQNTYIPLDMVFIRADGTVARIAERTEPLSTRTIPSGEPVLGVLEVNAGVAERIGLKAGDRVEHPMFRPR